MKSVVIVVGATGLLLVYLGTTAPPRPSRVWSRFERLGKEAGRDSWGSAQIAFSCVMAAVAAAMAAAIATSSLVVIVLSFGAGLWSPVGWLRSRARKRRLVYRDVWPEAIALLVSGVRSGLSLPEVVAALAERGPEALRPNFHRFRATYRSTSSFETALGSLAEDLKEPTADRVVSALKLANEVGGTELVRVLRTLGDLVREDLRVRKEVEARWTWTVTAARLAAAAPWVVLVIMSSRPEAAAAYDSPNGLMVILGGAAATAVGYLSMLRAARLPEDERWTP